VTKYIAHLSTGGTLPFEFSGDAPAMVGGYIHDDHGSIINPRYLAAFEIVQEPAPARQEVSILDYAGDLWRLLPNGLFRFLDGTALVDRTRDYIEENFGIAEVNVDEG
jgi:hypothetical protein